MTVRISNEDESKRTRAYTVAERKHRGCGRPAEFPPDIRPKPAREALLPLEQMQQRHLLRALKKVNDNKQLAAQILGISRSTLYKLLAEAQAKGAATGSGD